MIQLLKYIFNQFNHSQSLIIKVETLKIFLDFREVGNNIVFPNKYL